MKQVKNRFRSIAKTALTLLTLVLISQVAVSQATIEDNTPSFGAFLGWDDITNENLDILQNNTLRQRFTSENWAGLNGVGANNASRIHLGLNGNFQNPFSMIHMGTNISGNLQRPWMNVGLTMGATADILHLGLLQRPVPGGPNSQVDAVIAWGCNDDINVPGAGPDNFRFLFIAPDPPFPPGSPSGDANEEQGRETMRITPMGNVGIGDFSHMPNGLDEQPTHRLDVDGTARLRQMPNDTMDVIITGVYAEDPGVAGDYVLNYSTVEDFIDWNNLCDSA